MPKTINIIVPHGFCFGVNRAIDLAKKAVADYPNSTYILGEIVHNQHVVDDLKKIGIKIINSLDEIPEKSTIIIRAHGATLETYKKAQEKNLIIIDTTCPIVTQVHNLVKKLASENKEIVYIASDINHDEAIGVASEAPQSITLTTLKDINNLEIKNPQNTFVITQTTLSVNETKVTFDNLKQKYPPITICPHICQATTERQKAILDSATDSDIIIIVGSKTSSNSKRLVEAAQSTGCDSYIVETAADLNPNWFINKNKISISSGASTQENLLEEVVEKIKSYEI